MTIDSTLVLLVLQFRVVVKCISINQYRYRYRDIDIHRLRHYMIIDGVRLFPLTPREAYHHHKSAASAPVSCGFQYMSWSGTRNWHPAQDRNGRSSAVHSQPNRKSIQHHANISLKSQALQISFQPKRINKSWNHTISWGHNFIPSSLVVILQSFSKKNKLHYVGVPVTSSKENSDAHQTKRTKPHIECLRRMLGNN